MYDHLTTVSRHMNTLGWANYANDHEDANGQFEQNFRYADALTTADRVIVFRYMVHSLAAEAGMLATFMPKPFSNLTGQRAAHAPEPVGATTAPSCSPTGRQPSGLGMSRWATPSSAGCSSTPRPWPPWPARRSTPTSGWPAPPRLGRGLVPVYATYGGNDRTHMLRVPDPGRVEDRCIDGSANPYLAISA
jgi:hypothetical protein